MYRCYIEPKDRMEEEIRITGEDVNHIKNVLRMRTGEALICCDGAGTDYLCEIVSLEKEAVLVRIKEKRRSKAELPVRYVLFQGLPKKDKMELIIQKAVELGAAEIVPVMTKRTVVRLEDAKKEQKKLERWQAIARSAAEQSGRGVIPVVRHVSSWKEMLDSMGKLDYNIVLYENAAGMAATKDSISKMAQGKSAGILVGPEGGFEEDEVEQAVKAGAVSVSLGHRIVRTETAGFAVLSALMLETEYRSEQEETDGSILG